MQAVLSQVVVLNGFVRWLLSSVASYCENLQITLTDLSRIGSSEDFVQFACHPQGV